ncbi:MAG: hypothetical protein KZQ62_03230 [Candidatus Thiodiazotropha sp. (ex Lucinoma aequizonata)]|nr:hypothetical protein [Candidatus Thiodiazotropha sp. (ex Lucinoma aequizonata)]MCU7900180.1 hypothetical protein [Candidatus Thiodiazotropha sp. (ex Lucinoma aequizonata)]
MPFLSPRLSIAFSLLAGFFRFESLDGGLLLFLLLRVMRLSRRLTRSSKTSSADLSAGDRPLSFLRSSLTELIAESTSISSIFNYLHPLDPE